MWVNEPQLREKRFAKWSQQLMLHLQAQDTNREGATSIRETYLNIKSMVRRLLASLFFCKIYKC